MLIQSVTKRNGDCPHTCLGESGSIQQSPSLKSFNAPVMVALISDLDMKQTPFRGLFGVWEDPEVTRCKKLQVV